MNPEDVATYLRTHPQFFEQYPELLEKLKVPHPYGGRAIPLAERQTVALREKARVLEGKLGELLQFGEENDVISERVHRLAVAIAGARDFGAVAQSITFHLREDFEVPHVALRVWGKSLPAGASEAEPVSEAQRLEAAAMAAPQCGPASSSAFAGWFGAAAAHLGSLALVPLGEATVFGMLALAAEDPKRFYPEMGTLYLRRIGELCAAGLTARL